MNVDTTNFFTKLDKVCDYMPVVSTLSNITDLVQQVLVLPFLNTDFRVKNNYYTHLECKTLFRPLLLLIPVIGNIIVAIIDYAVRKDYSRESLLLTIYGNRDFDGKSVIRDNSSLVEHASDEIKDDKNFVLRLVQKNGKTLRFVSDRLKNDPEVVNAAVQYCPEAYRFASGEIREKKDFLIALLRNKIRVLRYATDLFKADKEVVSVAVDYDYTHNSILLHIGNQLKRDWPFMVGIIRRHPAKIHSISDELKSNKKFLLEVIEVKPELLLFLSQSLNFDRVFLLEACKKNPLAFQYLVGDFKGEREFVLDVVARCPEMFQYATPILRADPDFVLETVKRNPGALDYASPELFAQREFMLNVIEIYARALNFNETLASNDVFIKEAAEKNGLVLEFVPPNKKTIDVVYAAVKQNPAARHFIPVGLTSLGQILIDIEAHPALLPLIPVEYITIEMAERAIEENPLLLEFVSDDMKLTDRGIMLTKAALEKNPEALKFVTGHLLTQEIVDHAIQIRIRDDLLPARYRALKKLADQVISNEIPREIAQEWALPLAQFLYNDPKFIVHAIKFHGVEFLSLSNESKDDEEVVYAVLSEYPDEIVRVSDRLKADEILKEYVEIIRKRISQRV